ncbi:MAG: virulence RhuM family protein, partial [Prevotellaceae bacterium]|nr:virulence RhuM family protein [Prevotellaceae bacterium]
DFLIFTRQNGEDGIAVRVEDENVWLHSEAMAQLFQKDRRTIQEHLRNIFADGEQDENSVCRNFRHTATDGKSYQVKFYSLEAIIAVGYRADSERAIEFRKWDFAESEFEKYRVIQDKNYMSDFDRLVEQAKK